MKIYDGVKILAGLAVFLILVTYPFWANWGKTQPAPDLSLDTPTIDGLPDKLCVESAAFMRTNHMKLLEDWMNMAVRDGNRLYQASDGRTHHISLTGSCLSCHSNKSKFCDRCHDHVRAKPACYRCHIIPQEAR